MTIECDLDLCERGNILLVHQEQFNLQSYLRLGGRQWLEISYRHTNYPALFVQTVEISDEDLAKHIQKEFANGLWYARKMNLDVPVDENGCVSSYADATTEDE